MGLSNVEDILQAGLDGIEIPAPESRVAELLKEWIEESNVGDILVAGSNITLTKNIDGTITIAASGEISADDTVAREKIAVILDGTTIDSFGDVETALSGKADTTDIPTVPITAIQKNGTGITPVSGTVNITVPTQASDINAATATQGDKADTAVQTIKVNSASTGVTKTGDTVDITAIPASIVSAGALENGMTATTQETSDDSTKVATTAFVHDVVDTLPSPMVYKGTLGTGGTKTTLPVDGTAEVGDTYKVITAGTYASQASKVGDMFICLSKATSSNTWSYIPSGDDTDVTQVSAGTGLTTASGSPITTTGTIKAKLKSGTALAEAATNSTTSGKSYAVNVDSNGDLACNVPWTDTTYNFEGTYDGTFNKAATMADIKDGKLTGYTVDSSKSTIGATTKVVDAIEQLDYRTQTNETNILNIETQNRNKLPYTLDTLKANNTAGTWNNNVYTINNLSFTVNADMSISVTLVSGDTPTATYFYLCPISDLKIDNATYIGYARYNNYNVDYSTTNYFGLYGVSGVANLILNTGVDIPSDYASRYTHAIIRISAALTPQYQLWKPVIEDKTLYTAGITSYIPYTPSNRELYDNLGGSDYIVTASGRRLYISDSAPTGEIPVGSIGVGW